MSSLGPAEESHSDLPPAQLHCSLWQMAGFVPASCSVPVPGALPGGAGPQGSALGLCFLGIFIFSNGLQLQAERACVGALPASAHGLWCRLCMPFLYFIQQRGVTAELPGLLQKFLAWPLRSCICFLSATCVTPTLLRELEHGTAFCKGPQKVPYHLVVNNFSKWERSLHSGPFQVK